MAFPSCEGIFSSVDQLRSFEQHMPASSLHNSLVVPTIRLNIRVGISWCQNEVNPYALAQDYPMPRQPSVAIYARVSTNDKQTPDAQLRDLRQYAAIWPPTISSCDAGPRI